jgi:RTX calcium-binding nonapeptide repeat (4 copies)
MHFTAGHSYNITEANGNVAAGAAFLFDGSALGAGDNLTISAPNESNSLLTFTAGAGTNTFTSGNQDSTFNGGSGTDIFTGGNHADDFNMNVADTASTLTGGGGNDVFNFAAFNPATDNIDGGTGNDTVVFQSGTFTLTATDLVNVERIELGTVNLTTVDATVAAGQTMTVDARGGAASFDGSAETDGHFSFFTGIYDVPTTLIGGALSDSFNLATPSDTTVTGGGGADTFLLTGSQFGSNYTFVYDAVSDSTSTGYDTITHVNYNDAKFDISGIGAVTGVDTAVHTGSLSTATFDSDLAADIGAGQLAAHHAVLFTASAGTLSGDTFLIVDENGTAGYQAGADLVIDVTGHTGSGTLTAASFI